MLNCHGQLFMCHHGPFVLRYRRSMVADALARLWLGVAGCQTSAVQKEVWPGHVRGNEPNALRNIVPPNRASVFGSISGRNHISAWHRCVKLFVHCLLIARLLQDGVVGQPTRWRPAEHRVESHAPVHALGRACRHQRLPHCTCSRWSTRSANSPLSHSRRRPSGPGLPVRVDRQMTARTATRTRIGRHFCARQHTLQTHGRNYRSITELELLCATAHDRPSRRHIPSLQTVQSTVPDPRGTPRRTR